MFENFESPTSANRGGYSGYSHGYSQVVMEGYSGYSHGYSQVVMEVQDASPFWAKGSIGR